MQVSRLIAIEDAPALAQLVIENRAFLAPFDPQRPSSYFTLAGQRRAIEDALAMWGQRTLVPHVILDHGEVVGRVTLSNIVRGPLLSGDLGYWVSAAHNGRGLATAAVAEMVLVAFRDLALHRVAAGTLLHNHASQRVLEHNGFARYGVAPKYLRIAGRWQDHALYQRLNPELEG